MVDFYGFTYFAAFIACMVTALHALASQSFIFAVPAALGGLCFLFLTLKAFSN